MISFQEKEYTRGLPCKNTEYTPACGQCFPAGRWDDGWFSLLIFRFAVRVGILVFQEQASQSGLEKSGEKEGKLPFKPDPHLEQNHRWKSRWFGEVHG